MLPYHHPPLADVRRAVSAALAEDLMPLGDISADLIDPDLGAAGRFIARAAGTIAGEICVRETLAAVHPGIRLDWKTPDGTRVSADAVVATVEGPLAAILSAERTALNFLCHLSGIATETARYTDAAGSAIRIWDTRKTTPGLRSLEKAAVRAGGGFNHRGNLSEWVMLKDNHLTELGIAEGVARARRSWPARTIHVECERLEQVKEAAESGADVILLDNMTPDEVREGVAVVAGRALVEASGGIDLDSVAEYAATGVDLISVGRITNSAPALDIALDITPGARPQKR